MKRKPAKFVQIAAAANNDGVSLYALDANGYVWFRAEYCGTWYWAKMDPGRERPVFRGGGI